VICFAPSLADSIIFLTLTRLVVVIIFENFSFALFTPPLGDFHGFPKLASSKSLFLGAPDTVRCAPDSPVNYSEAALDFSEGEEFSVKSPGAPDTVQWHTGQSGAPDQGTLRLSLALFVEPNSWSFYWLSVNLWHLYNLYNRAN
jgi:hypothetical protein